MFAQSPQFLIPQRSRSRIIWENLVTVCCEKAPRLGMKPGLFSQVLLVPPRDGMRLAFLASAFLHGSVIFFFLYFPYSMLRDKYFPARHETLSVIVMDPAKEILYLPVLRVPGTGGRPGKGTQPDPVKRAGSARVDLRFTAVSNPPAPDNKSQTILHPPAPPALRVAHDVPLPDLILARVKVDVPQRPPKLEVSIRRPPRKPEKPKSAIPPKPIPELPKLPTAVAELNLAKSPIVPLLSPKLVLPEPPSPDSVQTTVQELPEAPPMVFTGLESAVDLLSLSIHPESLDGLVSLPFGNRQGEFSISPNGDEAEAQSDSADGKLGSGGPGPGGDSSVGPGNGNTGGGGGESGFSGSVTISPREGDAGIVGELPALLRNWIFPVGKDPVVPRFGFVISTGPTGGGGLRVYGVLRGGKVYTTYLSMPEQNWILEYSLMPSGKTTGARSGAIQLSMDSALSPPLPQQKFNFYRPASVSQRSTQRIVLHGVIREDGTVEDLKVFQGVQADTDELARIAFSQWRFRPASRGDQSVAVEILVGIPASGPLRPESEGDVPTLVP